MGHLDIQHITFSLPDGRILLLDVSFRVGEGAITALIGANGAGKSTLMRMIAGDEPVQEGSIARTGGLGVMRQFVGHMTDGTVRDLLLTVAPAAIANAAAKIDATELAMLTDDSEKNQMTYAQAIADWADVGGYEIEVLWDVCTMAAIQLPFDQAQYRSAGSLSGGEQKRLVLEALLRGPEEVLLLDEPDNYLDVPGKKWLEEQLNQTKKTVLYVSHDRELLANTAKQIVTLELGHAGNSVWIHGGGFATHGQARKDRFARLEELRRRWDEEHQKIKDLVQMLKVKAKFNDGLASRYQAAQTRLRKFEEIGPPQEIPIEQNVKMRLKGGRTGKRAVVCEKLSLTGLVEPFDLEIWFGERIGVLGANGSGKSHFLRLLAAGGTDPELEHLPISDVTIDPVTHEGKAKLGARIRPGWFAQTHHHPELVGRTLIEILHRGDEHRNGMQQEQSARALDRYGLAGSSEQKFESLSGGQQARFQILLLELSGATLLLLDEPTDNLDLESAEALERALDAFEGTVLAVTHDRWFSRTMDRFIVFGGDSTVRESDEPVWDEKRAKR
ncbi:MAG: ATP-binding cassette domain-containing protein [Candidatus Nanopelagicales bacterium]|jgi:ATPase subunit of ABC transporter with duplicated ATPase domains|nr:ATP-binding cassette domain-containing protein [Candidatus Nanopelagicales bacterium]MDP4666410.1 ATP-binding cassette domain-containing protein [Candidatus Nanopelagicales bacterium]MDP4896031.1 ATP-binding cassette domain-containing protein [Candidatus Nanopelagicales bacterium]MDP5050113.1 ATP-binding cassette domain-containing protein [Candidatus Nanopelagicales bacterium]